LVPRNDAPTVSGPGEAGVAPVFSGLHRRISPGSLSSSYRLPGDASTTTSSDTVLGRDIDTPVHRKRDGATA
jgi:hypothetical protein